MVALLTLYKVNWVTYTYMVMEVCTKLTFYHEIFNKKGYGIMKKTVATKLYEEITSILFEEGEINTIPPLKKTENSSVYGYLRIAYTKNPVTGWKEEKYVGIYLNLQEIPNYKDCYNLNKVHYSTYRDNCNLFINAIDTICHELAHMKCRPHGPAHSRLTQRYIAVYFSKCGHLDIDGKFNIKHFLSDVKEHA